MTSQTGHHIAAGVAGADASRVPVLDGIRGLAILLVLFYHFSFYSGMKPEVMVDKAFLGFTLAGWSGVDLFFVLSGFLITGILCDARGGRFYFRNFYARRCLRIFPLYYGVLAFCFVVLPSVSTVDASYRQLIGDQAWYWTYLANVRIAFNGWPEHLSLGHFWSLAVEEQFYLVWPAVVHWCSRRQLILVCIGCIVGALLFRVLMTASGFGLAAYVLTVSRMDALALGALLAVLARAPEGLIRWRRLAVGVLAGGAVALLTIAVLRGGLAPEDPVVRILGYSLLAGFYGALLVVVVTSPPGTLLSRVFSARVLLLLGRYSYGLYVFHHLIVGEIRREGIRVAHHQTLFGSQLPAHAVYVLVAGGLTLLVAVASWHLFEDPILRLKNRFPYARR